MQIRAYVLAADGNDIEAVKAAARAFMQGRVKGHNPAFAPSCAEFAEECRAAQARIEAEKRPRIEAKPKEEDNSPRVAPWKLKLLDAALRGGNEAKAQLRKMYPHLAHLMPDTPEQTETIQ